MDTPTLPDDELALPHFEQRLLGELVANQRAGAYRPASVGTVSPNGATPDQAVTDLGDLDDRPAPVRFPRRRRWPAVVAVGGVAAAVLAATLVVARDDGGPDVRSENPVHEDPDGPTDEQVLDALDAALATSVVHTADDGPGSRQSWSDAQSRTERHVLPGAGAKPVDRGRSVAPGLDEQGPPSGPVPMRDVNYCRQEWADVEAQWLEIGTVVGRLQGGLDSGELHVDGAETVDGRELVRVSVDSEYVQQQVDEFLHGAPPGADPEDLAEIAAAQAASSPTFYLDPQTLLPVLARQFDGTTTTIEFLPRESSLELLVPPVPEGFVQVPDITTDDEIAALGCL